MHALSSAHQQTQHLLKHCRCVFQGGWALVPRHALGYNCSSLWNNLQATVMSQVSKIVLYLKCFASTNLFYSYPGSKLSVIQIWLEECGSTSSVCDRLSRQTWYWNSFSLLKDVEVWYHLNIDTAVGEDCTEHHRRMHSHLNPLVPWQCRRRSLFC
jgi:hypothetical protein